MPENRMRIAYIHDSPLFERLETDYRDPLKLRELGFTDVVLSDQMNGCLFGVTPELVDQVETVSDLGLGVWLMGFVHFACGFNCGMPRVGRNLGDYGSSHSRCD